MRDGGPRKSVLQMTAIIKIHSSRFSTLYYTMPNDGVLSDESERVWKEAVVISFEGITKFLKLKISQRSFKKFCDYLKKVTTASIHIISNSLVSIPSFDKEE